MSLPALLDAAHHILDPSDDPHAAILRVYADIAEQPPSIPDHSLPALRLAAARCALHLLHRVQLLLDRDTPVGARDLAVLRSLLSLLFHWGINPLLANPGDPAALFTLLSDLMSTLFVRAPPPHTFIPTTILRRHLPDLLRASTTLAWLPKSRWPQDGPPLHALRPSVLRLLELCVYCVSAQMKLNIAVKSPPVPDNGRSRRCLVEHAPAPAPCPQIMFIPAHKESTPSRGYPSALCRCFW